MLSLSRFFRRRQPHLPWQSPAPEAVSHILIRDTGERLRAECLAKTLTTVEADQIVGLFKWLAQRDGHVVAYDTATRRATQIALKRGWTPPDSPPPKSPTRMPLAA